jgi:hypothetical protein
MAQTLIDPSQLFLTGKVLETVYQWSNILKSFQQRLSPYFARQEAPVRCLQLYSSSAQSCRTEEWMANGGTDW